MSSKTALQHDPVLAMLPEIRGRRVLHPCVLYARLGRGGMGAVYLGKHLTLRQRQVVKCLWLMGGNDVVDDVFVDRFHQEARIAAEMTHQNLVRVTHIDRLGELHYLVMEYIEGEDVERRVKRRGALDERQALTLLLGAARGLGYAHARGIVHRDVKPANVMISSRGEVKVVDLGLARATHNPQQLRATIGTLGTPLYMAPEQWDSASVGATADVWALGATLHFALAGRCHVPADITEPSALRKFVMECPFPGVDGGELRIDEATRRVLRRCVERDPGERYPDARALAADLARLVAADDDVLADPAAVPNVVGDEPDDDELAALVDELQQQANRSPRGSTGTAPARTLADTTDAPTMVFRPAAAPPLGSTLATVPSLQPAPLAPTPAAPTAPPAPTAVARRSGRSRTTIVSIAAAAVVAIAGAAGFATFDRLDPDALQREAMAAIYQQRYLDADRVLAQLETAPAFADQARRLRVDALVKEGERISAEQPAQALVHFANASKLAERLLVPKDRDDGKARVAALRAPLEDALRARLAGAVELREPQPNATVVGARQRVVVRIAPTDLRLRATVDGKELQAVAGTDTVSGEWAVPAQDGPRALRVEITEPTSGLTHTIVVPVQVKRGATALTVDAPTEPPADGVLTLGGAVHNGPVDVRVRVVRPDGTTEDLELGPRDGTFSFTIRCAPELDGEYRTTLHAMATGSPIESSERVVLVDRRAPTVVVESNELHTNAKTFLLRGTADEACRVFVQGQENRGVPTDGELAFALPIHLPANEGPVHVALLARDPAGNLAAVPLELDVVVDRTPPRFVDDGITFAARTANERITITGRLAEAGAVAVGDGDAVSTAPDGSFTIDAPLPTGPIEQTTTLRLGGRDRANNAAAPVPLQVFVDRAGPTILPAAPDGSWWSDGRWMLRVEDASGPCTATLGDETRPADADGRVDFPLRSSTAALEVVVTDALGNTSRRTLSSPRAGERSPDKRAPGPTWATPAEGSTVDPATNLYERVVVPVGSESLVLRLVRPLRDDELPPPAQRDTQAVNLLQGRAPFYLSETEVSVAAWIAFAKPDPTASRSSDAHVFDPTTCRWAVVPDAGWQSPLHDTFAAGVPPHERARWPVTQVSPAAARAFCERFGFRLPREEEWWFVARLGNRHRYGWRGTTTLENRANLADLSLQAKAPNLAAFETVDDHFASLAPVDAFPRGGDAHPWGFRSLLGNVAEWCTGRGDRTVARGGSWLSEPRDLRVDELRQDNLITSGCWDHVGFRVARDL